MKDYYDTPSLDSDLTDEEYELFFTEADADLSEEELFENPGQKDLLETEGLSKEEWESWNEKKEQLNYWGNVFSQGGTDAIIAAEKLQDILCGIVKNFGDDGDKHQEAYQEMVSRFPGSRDNAVRFLKHYYPEQLVYNAIAMTIGLGLCRDNSPSSRRYDHRKGASFVTYFNNLLYGLSKDEQRHLAKRWKRTEDYSDQLQDKASFKQYQNRPKTADRRAITTFAQLTQGVLQLNLHLPDPGNINDTRINEEFLQLFYTLQLVNFSRLDGNTGSWEYVLMDAADQAFLTFSTTLEETDHYPALIDAHLSRIVYEEHLYRTKAQVDFLADKSVVCYTGTDKSNVSKHFRKIRARLSGPMMNALKVCEE